MGRGIATWWITGDPVPGSLHLDAVALPADAAAVVAGDDQGSALAGLVGCGPGVAPRGPVGLGLGATAGVVGEVPSRRKPGYADGFAVHHQRSGLGIEDQVVLR